MATRKKAEKFMLFMRDEPEANYEYAGPFDTEEEAREFAVDGLWVEYLLTQVIANGAKTQGVKWT